MVTPPFLLESSVPCGTTTYIADPHEAANVMGWEGIRYFVDSTRKVPANVYFMLPSCVPATPFEMSGCVFSAAEMYKYKDYERVLGLGEVMDYVSVVTGEPEMIPISALLRMVACAGPLRFRPVAARDRSTKSWPAPDFARNAPNSTKTMM